MSNVPPIIPSGTVPELRPLHADSVRLAPSTRVPLPDDIRKIVDHPLFQRLRYIKQLGFAERVYPSATHTRFAHSLGVYSAVLNYIHALWEIPEFNTKVRARHIRALLAAALCHDLGQYPYSHVLEDTERKADGSLKDSIFDHERLTEKLLCNEDFRRELGVAGAESFDDILVQIGTSRDDVLSILSGKLISANEEFTPEIIPLLRSILSGPIDADKLDYLNRDGHHTGVEYGRIDSHRFFQSLTIVPSELLPAGEKPQIALTLKGRVPAEQFLMGRLHMFTEVYWHAGVRAHEAVLATAVQRVRRIVEGFDTWFGDYIARPGVGDEWYKQIRAVAMGGILSRRQPRTEEQDRIAESVIRMIDSLSVETTGRAAYTTLLEVSNLDRKLYAGLQRLREWEIEYKEPMMELLAREFASRVSTQLSIDVDPLSVVFDIPPKRSPANTVFFVEDNPPRRQEAKRLAELWPMWGSFVTDFHERMSVVRVFMPRDLRNRLIDDVQRNDLILYEALGHASKTISRRVLYDLPLFEPA